MNNAKANEDECEREHERSLRAVDPRVHQGRYAPRMRMFEDERTGVERGMNQRGFIDPERSKPNRRARTNTYEDDE
jgi:hypothetical protein